MHFKGITARWLQSVDNNVRKASWAEFGLMMHDRFGRDQHKALICQLFHIWQSGSISEYVNQFSVLVNQLAAYESNFNPLYYATRFVDGLRDDLKSMVMIQRPSTFDVACVLALVQEEATEGGKKEYRRSDYRGIQRPAFNTSQPPKFDKLLVEDKKNLEPVRANALDDKLRALKQYRRARGLCDFCAEKWTHGHKCSTTVLLSP
jgi:hypothetical protein